MPVPAQVQGAIARASYVANAVTFDGSNDNLQLDADFTGNSDSKQITFSFWFRRTRQDADEYIYGATFNKSYIRIERNFNLLQIRITDTGGSTVLFVETLSGITDTLWHHVSFSCDMSDTNKRHLFLDGVSDLNVNTYTNATLDFTQSKHAIGSSTDPAAHFQGDLADVFLDFGTYTDLSSSNPFRDASGKPVDPKRDGSGYGLGVPTVMLTGRTSNWPTNEGSGGGFTENGALTDAGSSPSE